MRVVHRTCLDKRTAYRINAILLLGCGWTLEEVATALLIDEKTLRSYVKRYKTGGVKQLLKDKQIGGLGYLSEQEKKCLVEHLRKNTYQSTQDIIRYVENEFGVVYTVSGITDLLHTIGFSYKKPKIVPGKANPQAQKAFLKDYEKLKQSKGKDDPIYFMDGTHPQHNTLAGYGWIERGKEKEFKSNSGRQRLNINGALNIETMDGATVLGDAVNAETTIELFEKLEKKSSIAKVIYVICDNARYYRSKKVASYLKNSRIRLVFLPPYSPNLNLIERYWKLFKKKVLYNRYYEKFDEFKSACLKFFRNPKRYKRELGTLLTENFHIMGEATI